MKKLLMVIVISVVSLMWFACAQRPDPEKIKTAAKELDDKFMVAFNKEDLDGVMDCYWNSPEVIIYPPDVMESRGYEAVKSEFEKFFAENEIKGFEPTNTSYMALGDYGLGWGNFSITLGLPDGQETKLEGRFTSISGMKDGKWVYIIDHASAPLPPPPTMEEMQKMMKEMSKKK